MLYSEKSCKKRSKADNQKPASWQMRVSKWSLGEECVWRESLEWAVPWIPSPRREGGILPSNPKPGGQWSWQWRNTLIGASLVLSKGKVAGGADGDPVCGSSPLSSRLGQRCVNPGNQTRKPEKMLIHPLSICSFTKQFQYPCKVPSTYYSPGYNRKATGLAS